MEDFFFLNFGFDTFAPLIQEIVPQIANENNLYLYNLYLTKLYFPTKVYYLNRLKSTDQFITQIFEYSAEQ